MGLTYNGVDLSFVLTERLEQESVLDQTAGVDQLYTMFRLSVRAVVAPLTAPSAGSELPAATVARVRHLLLQPRKTLAYTAPDGTTLVAADSQTDAANGPFPRHFNPVSVLQGSIVVDYVIDCRLPDCSSGGRQYVSLRWTETVSYDEVWRTTKRRSGTLVVRTGIDPDGLRGLVTPGVANGFRRESASYTLSADNVRVDFAYVDKEMMRPPPWPAIRMRGRQVETTPMPGAIRLGEISLVLDGPKGVSPRDLLNAGIRVAVSRANSSGIQVGASGRIIIGGSISETLDDDTNRVEITLRWKMKPVAGRTGGTAGTVESIVNTTLLGLGLYGYTHPQTQQQNAQGRDTGKLPVGYAGWVGAYLPGSDPNRAIGGPTRGTAPNIRLIAAALNDPCGQSATYVQTEANLWAGTASDGGTVELRTSAQNYLGTPTDATALYVKDEPTPGVWDDYELHAIYKDAGGNAICPSTKAGELAAEIQVFNCVTTMTLEWTASRTGGPPTYPMVLPPYQQNVRVLFSTISVKNVDLAGDGVSLVYSVSGITVYGFLDREIVAISAPVPPFLALGSAAAEPASVLATAQWPFPMSAGASGGANPFTGQGVGTGATGGGVGGPPVQP